MTEKVRPPEWWPRRERCAVLLPLAIERTFADPATRERVAGRVARTYPLTREEARIGLALVFLSGGDESRFERDLAIADRDWRTILIGAESRPYVEPFFAWIEELDAAAGG